MTATAKPSKQFTLPESLRSHADAIAAALLNPYPVSWEKGVEYLEAVQPEAIGGVLVRALHPELLNAKIGYLFREKLKDRDRTRLAQASKVTGKLAHYTALDLLIEVNWSQWRFMKDGQRLALIDHELQHFARDEDAKGKTVYGLVSHDLEEFSTIVRRWGAWKGDIFVFKQALEQSPQLGIFDNSLV